MNPELDLKPIHDVLQIGLEPNQICIREGIVLEIDEESRFPFEFFTFRSPEMTYEMSAFIKYSKDKNCLLDIGAFHGIFSMVFCELNKDGCSYAFEPYEVPFNSLLKNCSKNVSIQPVCFALSDNTEEFDMFTYDDHLVINKINDEQKKYTVRSCIADEYCHFKKILPDIIKIDVESMELKVLKGLSKTIELNHPLIFLELHCGMLKDSNDIAEILNLVKKWGYNILNSETDEVIFIEEILSTKTGELRLILNH